MNTSSGAATVTYKPGALVRLRGREWVVESSAADLLRVRPPGGSSDDIEAVIPALETEPVEEASFPYPDLSQSGPFHSCLLLKDALVLKSRASAGPFRSFGGIAVEPRAYQLVPLLMALKQKTIRLLIADDVGIGKTIEACLIIREMIDRGEIERFAVLCPPHLVEQWVTELKTRFHIEAQAITASNVNRLERNVPHGLNLFRYWPYFVISLDYIKNDAHKNFFLANAPEMILVDEAHTCTSGSVKKQQRFELLKALKEFYNLLSLLRRNFANLANGENKELRTALGDYFVQRRRVDIDEWKDASLFPQRKTKEATYKLSGPWETFFEKVRDYCLDLAQSAETKHTRASHVIWYAILALLRCVSSSPAAAKSALTTHLRGNEEEIAALISASPRLHPVVFCRYIATANYVAEELRKHYLSNEKIQVRCITGELSPEEREEKVDALVEEADIPILVATDCLSEGINLQHGFDAMLHYDLAGTRPATNNVKAG